MKRKKLKKFVIPTLCGLLVVAVLLSFVLIDSTDNEVAKTDSNFEYVNSSIISNYIPVATEEKTIINPYGSDKVEISKKFYDINSTDEEKENAIIYYNDTYMQNSGVLYKSSESFDVISILEGTVIDVKTDEIFGNVVEVKHSNNLISTYQGLSTVNVKKDQLISQGEIIGKSGKLQLEETLENSLLFELIKDGKYVNPLNYINKNVNEL